MDFGLTEEQEALRKAARDFLSERSTTQLVRKLRTFAYDPNKGTFRGWLKTLTPRSSGPR